MDYITDLIKKFFTEVSTKAHIRLNLSPLIVSIEDDYGTFDAYYGFYSSGAVRVEANGDEIVGVSVWNSPQNLNTPNYRMNLSSIDPFSEIDTVVSIMAGHGAQLMRKSQDPAVADQPMFENTRDDINDFMLSIGGYAYSKKLNSLYHSFLQWAEVQGRKLTNSSYFDTLAKDWLITNGKGKYEVIEVTKGSHEETQVNGAQDSEFVEEIYNNPSYYKATLTENIVKRIMMDDPLINSFFLCGAPGKSKTQTVLNVAKQHSEYKQKVSYHSGDVKGFSGLLQLLWDNRRGKVLILDDCDSLLSDNNKSFSTLSILLAALETQEHDRVISYVRARKNVTDTKVQEATSWFDDVPEGAEAPKEEEPDEAEIPDEFIFESKLIFISNQSEIPEYLGDKCLALQLNYSKEQALQIVEDKLEVLCPEYPDVSIEDKKEILSFMHSHSNGPSSISFKAFVHIAVVYKSQEPRWEQWALYQLQGERSEFQF